MPEVGELVPELICLGIDMAICGALYAALRSTSSTLQQLAAAPELPLDENMLASVENHPSTVRSADLSSLVLPYAAVRGEVQPLGKTVTSAYAPGSLLGVIQKVVFTEHKRNMSRTGFWFDSQRVMHSYTNEAPFSLVPPSSSPNLFSLPRRGIEVMDWSDAARVDLDTVYDQFESADSSLGSHLWGWVVGDMQKGVQKTEEMLVSGSTLTGVGEVVAGPMGVRLQPPSDGRPYYLVRNSLSSLVKELEGSRTVIKVALCVFGGLGLVVGGVAAWKVYRRRRREEEARGNQRRVEQIREERVNRGPRPEGEAVPEHLQCVVCLGAEREVILVECGHVCCCADCAGELLRVGQGCPVCRSAIVRVGAAYIS